MKVLSIKKDNFSKTIVSMIFNQNKPKYDKQTQFMQLLVDSCENGYIDRNVWRVIAKRELKLTQLAYKLQMFKLAKMHCFSVTGVTIFLAPVYKMVKECEGSFTIMAK